jgi:anti-sigma factor RsiW
MNCAHFQENLYEYLDDTLSPSEKAAAEEHLRGCRDCHEAVEKELRLAQALTTRLEQAVEPVALDAACRRKIADAVRRCPAESKRHHSVSFFARLLGRRAPGTGVTPSAVIQSSWRFALPFAAAALLIAAIWVGPWLIRERTATRNASGSLALSERLVPVHVSYAAPAYTFQKEGDLVVDALTYDIHSMDGAFPLTK